MYGQRLLPCFVAVLLCGLPAGASGSWLQSGQDAARTGNAAGNAPEWPDVALRVAIVDSGGFSLWPDSLVVVNRTAYVTAQAEVFAVDLDRGEVRPLATLGGFIRSLATDGTHLFAVGQNHVWSVDLATGAMAWDQPVTMASTMASPVPPVAQFPDFCAHPAVRDGTLFVACFEPLPDGRRIVAEAFDTATGARKWDAPWTDMLGTQDPGTVPRALVGMPDDPASLQVSVVGAYFFVAVAFASPPGSAPHGSYQVYGVRVTDGKGFVVDGDAMPTPATPSGGLYAPPAPTGDASHAFVKGRFVLRFPLAQLAGSPPHDANRNIRPGPEDDVGAGFAYDGSHIFVTTRSTLHRFDRDLRTDVGFATVRLPEGEAWGAGPLMLFGNAIVGRSNVPIMGREGATTLRAYDATTGAPLWQHVFDEPATCAATEGAIVCNTSLDLVVLGTTPASMRPAVATSTFYPPTGEPVDFDLSGTVPGRFGPPTTFRAIWGDGSPSDWQASPILSHEYGLPGDYAPRFEVRNDANQTASTTLVLHVGQHDRAVTIWNHPFNSEYQNITFAVLGFIATGALALLGVLRAGRKRRRFNLELHGLEAAHQAQRDDASAHDRMLSQRAARVRSLFLERRIEDAHASFLKARIDEMRHGSRMAEVESRLEFLPIGMFHALREVLRDSRVSAFERKQFLDSVARSHLTTAQKAEVRDVVETWFVRDAAVTA